MIDMAKVPITIVIGGQFGSEGKGEVTARIAWDLYLAFNWVSTVRVGGPQAGHSVTFTEYDKKYGMKGPIGSKFPMCVIPCAFHIPPGYGKMYIGPGSEFDPVKFRDEYEMLHVEGYNISPNNMQIDPRATLHEHDQYASVEKEAGMVERIGSTSKGVGICRAKRIMRDAKTVGMAYGELSPLIQNMVRPYPPGSYTPDSMAGRTSVGQRRDLMYPNPVLVETAQGFGLSLHTSGYYPFCTSTDINPGRALSDAGVSSRYPHRVVLVVRTFPIRVHGNSGPMNNELTWDDMYKITKGTSPALGEMTTVTKKVRRIGAFDWHLFHNACSVCRPDAIVVTFMDYAFPELAGNTDWGEIATNQRVHAFLSDIEHVAGCPVAAVSTAPGIMVRGPRWLEWIHKQDEDDE